MSDILLLDFAEGIEDTSGNDFTPSMSTRVYVDNGCCYYHKQLDGDQGVDVQFDSITRTPGSFVVETKFMLSGSGWDAWLFNFSCPGWGGNELGVFLRRSGGDFFRLYVPADDTPDPIDLSAYFPSLDEWHVLTFIVRNTRLDVYLDGTLIYNHSNIYVAYDGYATFRFSGDSLGISGDGVIVDYHKWFINTEVLLLDFNSDDGFNGWLDTANYLLPVSYPNMNLVGCSNEEGIAFIGINGDPITGSLEYEDVPNCENDWICEFKFQLPEVVEELTFNVDLVTAGYDYITFRIETNGGIVVNGVYYGGLTSVDIDFGEMLASGVYHVVRLIKNGTFLVAEIDGSVIGHCLMDSNFRIEDVDIDFYNYAGTEALLLDYFYITNETEEFLPEVSGGGGGGSVDTYSVGPLKPNISTSFQLGANKVRADVKFKTGSISFQNHKVRTGYSLGAVKVQPIRTRSGNQMSTLGGGGGSSVQLPTPIAQWDADTFDSENPGLWPSRYNNSDFALKHCWDYFYSYDNDPGSFAQWQFGQYPTIEEYEGVNCVKMYISHEEYDYYYARITYDCSWDHEEAGGFRLFTEGAKYPGTRTIIAMFVPIDNEYYRSWADIYPMAGCGLNKYPSSSNRVDVEWCQKVAYRTSAYVTGKAGVTTEYVIYANTGYSPGPIIYMTKLDSAYDLTSPFIQVFYHGAMYFCEMTIWEEDFTPEQLSAYLTILKNKYTFLPSDCAYNVIPNSTPKI